MSLMCNIISVWRVAHVDRNVGRSSVLCSLSRRDLGGVVIVAPVRSVVS